MKVRLIGSPQTQWNIDGHYYGGESIVDLTPALVKKHKGVIKEYLESKEGIKKGDVIEVKEISKDKDGTSVVKVIYTKEELYDKTKSEQLIILGRLGIKPNKSNNNLKYEKDRVNAILKGQK